MRHLVRLPDIVVCKCEHYAERSLHVPLLFAATPADDYGGSIATQK